MKPIVLSVGCGLLLSLLLTACRSPDTATGEAPPTRPEIILRGADPDTVRQVARQIFLGRGYSEGATPLVGEMIFDRPAQPGMTDYALRVRLRLFAQGRRDWRLTGVPLVVERWRTELETERVMNAAYPQIQEILEAIKREIEGKAG
jgi:hypothetical protein